MIEWVSMMSTCFLYVSLLLGDPDALSANDFAPLDDSDVPF